MPIGRLEAMEIVFSGHLLLATLPIKKGYPLMKFLLILMISLLNLARRILFLNSSSLFTKMLCWRKYWRLFGRRNLDFLSRPLRKVWDFETTKELWQECWRSIPILTSLSSFTSGLYVWLPSRRKNKSSKIFWRGLRKTKYQPTESNLRGLSWI